MPRFFISYFFFHLFSLTNSYAQTSSPSGRPGGADRIHPHSPRMAMIFSTCVPGLGQAYNKKYWKIPIVYATMGTTIYLFDFNNKLYKGYKQAYINKTDTASGTIDLYPNYTTTDLQTLSNVYRRYRDLNIILTALFYTVNIVDAYVDAQLTTFDVSDNLSMTVLPCLNLSANKKPAAGLTLALTF